MYDDLTVDGRDKFLNVQKLVAAFNTGMATKNATLCQWLFPCHREEPEETQSRIKCGHTLSMYCPGYSISCAICAMTLPNVCGGVCPFAGLYCGVAGYACNLDNKKVPKPSEPVEVDDSEPLGVEGEEESDVLRFRSRFESGAGTGEELEMFEIEGRNKQIFARKTASEARPFDFEARFRSSFESGAGTAPKDEEELEMFEIEGRNKQTFSRKTASAPKETDQNSQLFARQKLSHTFARETASENRSPRDVEKEVESEDESIEIEAERNLEAKTSDSVEEEEIEEFGNFDEEEVEEMT